MKNLFLKTVFLLFCVSMLVLGCSKEDANTSNNLSISAKVAENELTKAKQLFVDMMSTSDYSNYKSTLMNFVDKMNGNVVILQTKEEYLDWISLNLAKTKFTSKEEFSEILDNLVLKQSILMTKNSELYSYLAHADEKQTIEIMQPSLATPPNVTTNGTCADGCMDQCELDICANNYVHSLNYGLGDNEFAYALADSIYWSQMTWIIGSFNNCLSNC